MSSVPWCEHTCPEALPHACVCVCIHQALSSHSRGLIYQWVQLCPRCRERERERERERGGEVCENESDISEHMCGERERDRERERERGPFVHTALVRVWQRVKELCCGN